MIEVIDSQCEKVDLSTVLNPSASNSEAIKAFRELPNTFEVLERKFYYIYAKSLKIDVSLTPELEKEVATHIKTAFPTSQKVTPAGHAKISQPDDPTFESESSKQLPTWLLRGLVDYGSIEYWPVFIPATLSLIDSAELPAKVDGILTATAIASKYKAKLEATGLLPLFRSAVKSCLHYLPPASKPEEAMQIFGPAVLCLLELATEPQHLDSVMREGPLNAFKFSQQNVKLVIYLLDLVGAVGERLQERSIVHLKDLIHIFVAVMADPFIDTCPELVEAASRMLARVMLQFCVPRISYYRYDILFGLAKAHAIEGAVFEDFVAKSQITAEEVAQVKVAVESDKRCD